jgi:hypothetical protein
LQGPAFSGLGEGSRRGRETPQFVAFLAVIRLSSFKENGRAAFVVGPPESPIGFSRLLVSRFGNHYRDTNSVR